MNFTESPKLKPLFYRIAFAAIASLFLFVLAGCASIEPMTNQVVRDVKKDDGNFDNFRFSISKGITMVLKDEKFSTTSNQTIVRKDSIRDEVRLAERKTGRLVSGDFDSVLNIYFEERGGTRPTIEFVQNKGTGPEDRYYFFWKTDTDTGERYIDYDGGKYVVNYSGNEEPYLLYKRQEVEKRTVRRIRGVR